MQVMLSRVCVPVSCVSRAAGYVLSLSCLARQWLYRVVDFWAPSLDSGALVRVPPFSPILFLIGPAGFEFPASSSSSF